MGAKLCIVAGCMNATAGGSRCPDHERDYQRERNARRGPGRTRHAPYRGVSLDGAECACCGGTTDLTRHHVIPLSWDTGTRAIPLPAWCRGFPLVALCRACNSSVGDRLMVTRECPRHGGAVEKFTG